MDFGKRTGLLPPSEICSEKCSAPSVVVSVPNSWIDQHGADQMGLSPGFVSGFRMVELPSLASDMSNSFHPARPIKSRMPLATTRPAAI